MAPSAGFRTSTGREDEGCAAGNLQALVTLLPTIHGPAMKHSVIIPLSRQEEDTLRLVAHGISSTRHLRPDDLDQLAKLRLVDRLDRKVTLSELGQIRMAQSQEEQFLSIIRAARDHQLDLRVV
jgi:hypothetical protein